MSVAMETETLIVDEDAWDDDEAGELADDEEPTVPCPYCKRLIHEDSPRCPYCGNYISQQDAPAARKPWWIIVGAVLVLYIVYRWIAG
jgi:uncharacterized paraquat-inducible protein A